MAAILITCENALDGPSELPGESRDDSVRAHVYADNKHQMQFNREFTMNLPLYDMIRVLVLELNSTAIGSRSDIACDL